ncbi:MAG: GDP-mannose 4,6-dehydratase [Candidatus Thorarchaeota archaeon]
MGKKRALITGINGMDGSHLADLLVEKGYEVFGMERRASSNPRINTKHLEGHITFVKGDMADQNSLLRILKQCDPEEVYNLASQSFVGESWNTPEHTSDITGLGVLRILEAIREYDDSIKFYQASSSEMFGKMSTAIADEDTPFYPRSPYGVAKLYGHWITRNYRESYGMFACSGILFNHESERRGLEFVTRKITHGVASIHLGMTNHITLGNLDAARDWGYAPDYVRAMWMMMQQTAPKDYVIATGTARTVREFLTTAFGVVGIKNWAPYVKTDPRYLRPAEIDILRGCTDKADCELGWYPTITFKEMVKRMVENDRHLLLTGVI